MSDKCMIIRRDDVEENIPHAPYVRPTSGDFALIDGARMSVSDEEAEQYPTVFVLKEMITSSVLQYMRK